jgi:heme/copper-type cytochrome/quinol oxidase subunit 2
MTPLHHIGDFFRDLVLLVPLWAARTIFVFVLLVVFIWVLRLSPERVSPCEIEERNWTNNLKLWAAIAIGLQIIIYLIL